MRKVRLTLALLMAGVLAMFIVATRYVAAAERHPAGRYASAADLKQVTIHMPLDEVVSLIGEPDRQTFIKDEGGSDPGFFRCTWNTPTGPVKIDFDAFLVTRIETGANLQSPHGALKTGR